MKQEWTVLNNKPLAEAMGMPAPHEIAPLIYNWEGGDRIGLYLKRTGLAGHSAAAVEGCSPEEAVRMAQDYFNRNSFEFNVEAGLIGRNGETLAPFRRVR